MRIQELNVTAALRLVAPPRPPGVAQFDYGSSAMSSSRALCTPLEARSSPARAGSRRPPSACSTTTSIPRWPSVPQDLVVYGGTGKAARNWECFDVIVRELRALGNDETLLVQSGKAVGRSARTPTRRACSSPTRTSCRKWATWDEFRRLEALGLTMFGQMTAGSWIYIGTQGILQGTYETFVAARRRTRRAKRADESGRALGPHRGPRRHGRRAAARGDDGGPELPRRRGRPVAHREAPRDALRRRAHRRSRRTRSRASRRRAKEGRAVSVALCANAAEVYPELVRREIVPDLVTEQTAAHDPAQRLHPARALARGGRGSCARRTRRATSSARRRAWPRRSTAMLGHEGARAPRSSTTATTSAPAPRRRGASARSTSRASCPRTSGRSSAWARGRSAGSRSAAIRPTSPRPTTPCSPPSRRRRPAALDRARARAREVPGAAGAHLLAGLRRPREGRARVQRARSHRAR